MKEYIASRCVNVAKHMIKTGQTVRQTGKVFGVTKSTIFKDVSERIYLVNKALGDEVKKVLLHNKSIRNIRGGEATRKLYEEIKNGKK